MALEFCKPEGINRGPNNVTTVVALVLSLFVRMLNNGAVQMHTQPIAFHSTSLA